MSPYLHVAIIVACWIALIAAIVAIFRAAKWVDNQVEDEFNVIAGTPSGFDRGAQREE